MHKFDPNEVLDFLVDFEILHTVEADSVLAELEDDITDDDLTDEEVYKLDGAQFGRSDWNGRPLTDYVDPDERLVDFLELALGFPYAELAE